MAKAKVNKRIQFKGTLNVYRDGSWCEHLSAVVLLGNKKELLYYRCPKAFDDAIADAALNVVDIEFTANKNGKNPRSVKVVGKPRRPY